MEKSILDRKVKVGGPYLSVISALNELKQINHFKFQASQAIQRKKNRKQQQQNKQKNPVSLLVPDHLSTRTR